MAAVDDIYDQITRNSRTRRGQSFFPAANGSAQGQVLIPAGGSRGGGVLPPDQNPAYQAAISKPRAGSDAYTWITTPSGGQMRVPTGSVGALLQPGSSLTGSQVTQVGNQLPIDRAAAYAKGYGAPNPTIQGGYQIAGGVANPIENLSPQARIAGGAGSTLDYFRSNPALTAATNALSGFSRNLASWFGGGNLPSVPTTANAAQPTPTPYQTPSPSPTPTATPFKTTDTRSDLLRDTEGTFYGGGQVPIPTPTPTPVSRYAYGPPRRYSDNFGYA